MNKILIFIKKIIPVKLFRTLQPVYHFLVSALASLVYRFPSERLIVVGITGTAGKTSSTFLLAQALGECGLTVGYTSTAMFSDGQKEWLNNKKMTMMGRFFIQKMLARMLKNGCQVAIVETTSEGIRQFRHRFINFDIVCFTGLYPEHIESHGSFEKYKQAKGKLFDHLARQKTKFVDDDFRVQHRASGIRKLDLRRIKKTIIANLDDEHAEYFLSFRAEKKIAYTRKEISSKSGIELIPYGDIQNGIHGTIFETMGLRINLQLLGDFNAQNAMLSTAVFSALSLPMDKLKSGLERVSGIAGRFERIDEGQDFTVIVDYAYEPVAMQKLYETIKLIPHKKIIHLLGSAGGGRDVARRPQLGRIAGENADYVIVTNEDPYDDDPQIIIDQVALGVEHVGKKINKNLFKILDRRVAITKAIGLAQTGDVVLITGKGSEQAICVADGRKISWDDRAVVREEMIKMSKF